MAGLVDGWSGGWLDLRMAGLAVEGPPGRGMKKIPEKIGFIPLFSLILRPQVWEFPLAAGTLTPKSK
jgi:hypothetical protein